MFDKLLRNARTALRHPDYLPQYARYRWQVLTRGGGAAIRLPWGDEIGGFVNFSEYRSAPHCLDEAERLVLARLAEVMRPQLANDAYILDVGANLGVTALYFAHLFPDIPILCFEPAPTTYSSLCANVKRNGRRNLACEQIAVSDSIGHVRFDVLPTSRANARISSQGDCGLSVPATRLDDFCAARGINRIALLKVDTEGYEHRVFAGAERLLGQQAIDVVYYEFCPALERSAGVVAGTAVKMLTAFGYTSFFINSQGRLESFNLAFNSLPDLCNLVAVSQMQHANLSSLLAQNGTNSVLPNNLGR